MSQVEVIKALFTGSRDNPAFRTELANQLLRARTAWPRRGPKARGWGEFLVQCGIPQARAWEIMHTEPSAPTGHARSTRYAESHEPRVYLLYHPPCAGAIKIGFTTSIERRVGDMQLAHATRLVVIATQSGGRREERSLHEHLAQHRLLGEWFADCEEVRGSLGVAS